MITNFSRCSSQFERGYRAGYARDKADPELFEKTPISFGSFDYTEGYRGGMNDRMWQDHFSKYGYDTKMAPERYDVIY